MTDAITKDLMDWGVHADVFPAFELPAKYSRHDISSLNEWARQAATYLRAAVDHIEDQEPPPASAIEAHSAETEGLGPKAESAARRETPVPLPTDAITKAMAGSIEEPIMTQETTPAPDPRLKKWEADVLDYRRVVEPGENNPGDLGDTLDYYIDKRDAAIKLAEIAREAIPALIERVRAAEARATAAEADAAAARKRVRELEAENIEREAELIYLRMYGKDGAVWHANHSKDVWREKARAALGRAEP
jgi:hypothetical protein